MGGKDIFDVIKIDFVSRKSLDDVFDLSKYAIKYNNKQVTVTVYDFKNKYSKKGEIFHSCLLDFVHLSESKLNFDIFLNKMNYKLPDDFNQATIDFKNCLKVHEGFKRLFSKDEFQKLCNFFGVNYY